MPRAYISPFPPRTGLQGEIDTLIARLVELRCRPICARSYDDEPASLRDLAGLLKDAASATDPLLQRIAYAAGVGSLSGASQYARIVSEAIDGELLFAIAERADGIDAARACVDASAEHRLTARELGVGR